MFDLKTKNELRLEFLERRQNFSSRQKKAMSQQISTHVFDFAKKNNINKLFAYWPVRNEPDIRGLFSESEEFGDKKAALPVIKKDGGMDFHLWSGEKKTRKNFFGIIEPQVESSSLVVADASTLICVPSLAVDSSGVRIGYGGGYYDRFLPNNTSASTIGIVYESHFCQKLPVDKWDFPLDYVCTEKGIFNCKNRIWV